MAGHSKWANIKHKKAATDAKRGKIFTRLIKELTVAARLGGSDKTANPRLRLAVEKAFDNNMPKDTVARAIKRGSGEIEGAIYEELRYEGYGISGSAVIVDCLTDNRARTVADVRHVFSKHGGNLGTDGSVAFLFTHCGKLLFSHETDVEALMDLAIDLGAEDINISSKRLVEVITKPNDIERIKIGLKEGGAEIEYADVIQKPKVLNILQAEDAEKMQKLLDGLEDLDDVQEVYTTAIIDVAG